MRGVKTRRWPSYEEWKGEVDDLCWRTWGLSINDLPDMNLRDAYEDGVSPLEFFHGELGTIEDLSRAILA